VTNFISIFLSIITVFAVKVVGMLREIIFVWYLGINDATSLIMMTNVIPAAIAGLLRYSSINILIYLKYSENSNEKFVDSKIGIFFFRVLILASLPTLFYFLTSGILYALSYAIYLSAAFIFAIIGYEEFTLLGKSNKSRLALGALLGATASIIFVIVFSELIGEVVLPIATLISAIINYLALPKHDGRIKLVFFRIGSKHFNFNKIIKNIAPILIIEIIGFLFGILDYYSIKIFKMSPVVFQFNHYAAMLYSLPVMIVGTALSAEIFKGNRPQIAISYIKENSMKCILFIFALSLSVFAIVFCVNQGILFVISDAVSQKTLETIGNISSLFLVYSFGIVAATCIYLLTKLLLTEYSPKSIAITYSFAGLIKLVIATIVCLSIDEKMIALPFSTAIAWLLLLVTMIIKLKHGKF
jgi:hypothetical protein